MAIIGSLITFPDKGVGVRRSTGFGYSFLRSFAPPGFSFGTPQPRVSFTRSRGQDWSPWLGQTPSSVQQKTRAARVPVSERPGLLVSDAALSPRL
jgi:hypothetical protein